MALVAQLSAVMQLGGKEGGEALEAEAHRAIQIVIRRQDNYSSCTTGKQWNTLLHIAKGRFAEAIL